MSKKNERSPIKRDNILKISGIGFDAYEILRLLREELTAAKEANLNANASFDDDACMAYGLRMFALGVAHMKLVISHAGGNS